MLQQLVDGWIMETEGSTAAPPVARITEFPHLPFDEDGFWQQVSMVEDVVGKVGGMLNKATPRTG